jgi:hypothetical protein
MIHDNYRIITYYIKDLYVNIPINDTLTITKALLKKHNDPQTTTQLLTLLETNNPQFAYALHILQNTHEYGPISDTMTLLQPVNKPNMLIPYEQFYIQSFHNENSLIPEQHPGEHNPLFTLALRNTLRHPPPRNKLTVPA